MSPERRQQAERAIAQILEICKRRGPILILMQDNPDPDALASAAALARLLFQRLRKRAQIGFGGRCGRAENRAMMKELGIRARHVDPEQLENYRTLCLVDTQPRFGNNICRGSRTADIVIDHHLTPSKRPWTALFADVRPEYGACSTILYEYLRAADILPDANLATALFYGIQSDTQDLGRNASPEGVYAYTELFLSADKKKLARIRRAPVPAEYFQMLAEGLANATVAGNTVISFINNCRNADMIAEVADLLMRLQEIRAALCYGVFQDAVYLSARGVDARNNMAARMKRAVAGLGTGGGHHVMAGGKIPLGNNPEKRLEEIHQRVLRFFASGKKHSPLLATAMVPVHGQTSHRNRNNLKKTKRKGD
jgi:nanoRNase/pAp phosphatase (c-di-AMP/oligoRNAs hydrolase)